MLRLSFLITSLFFLSACVSVQKHPLPPDSEIAKQAAWEVHRVNLELVSTWSLKGRVAGKSNEEGFRAGVKWREQPKQFSIDLLGPLGRKVAVINGDDVGVELKTSKGKRYNAADPESLMQDLFGYSLPVHGLRYWLRGIPDPGQTFSDLQLDEYGRLKQLNQAGWLIEYNRYHAGDKKNAAVLPAFIKISNLTLDANIIIDRWTLNALE